MAQIIKQQLFFRFVSLFGCCCCCWPFRLLFFSRFGRLKSTHFFASFVSSVDTEISSLQWNGKNIPRGQKRTSPFLLYRGRNNGQQNLLLFVAILSTTNLRIIFLRNILGVIFETQKIPEIFPTCVLHCVLTRKQNGKIKFEWPPFIPSILILFSPLFKKNLSNNRCIYLWPFCGSKEYCY